MERRSRRLHPGRRRGCSRGRAGERGALARGPPPRADRRRAGDRQGPQPDEGLPDPPGEPDDRGGRAGSGRLPAGRAVARSRGGDPRQDHHPRVRLEGCDRQSPGRGRPQPLGHEPDRGRLFGRGGGRRGPRHGGAAPGLGRRRLDPDPRGLHRHRGHEADLRPRPDLAGFALRHGEPRGAHDPHGGRGRGHAERAHRPRPPRLVRPAAPAAARCSRASISGMSGSIPRSARPSTGRSPYSPISEPGSSSAIPASATASPFSGGTGTPPRRSWSAAFRPNGAAGSTPASPRSRRRVRG